MGTLSDQLFKAGLISKEKFEEIQTKEGLVEKHNLKLQSSFLEKKGRKDEADLDVCTGINAFKHIAKEILLRDPSQIDLIIQKAHRFKDNKRFIWLFYQVRDGLRGLPESEHELFLNRSLRRAGSNPKLD
jgi:hypothetical protein